jgi:hypothetical protein
MVQRLLFDGINAKAATAPVSREDNAVAAVLADKTKASLAFAELA